MIPTLRIRAPGRAAAALLLALFTLGCTLGGLLDRTAAPPAREGPSDVVRASTLVLADREPETFDPARWRGSADGVIGDLFSGLVQLDANLQPIPDLAERWDVSDDGTVYTFRLRPGLVFHNGEPLTAHDVRYAWERACWPETRSDTAATYLGDIRGVDRVIAGETRTIAGLQVVDDLTLEVALVGPRAYFLSKLAYPTSWVVDETSVAEIEEHPVGSGPFVFVRHVPNERIVVARSPSYHRGPVGLEHIVYLIDPGPLLRLYELGEIDVAYLVEDLLERASTPGDPLYGTAYPTSELCTWYVAFDTTRPPFDETAVRQAFVAAVDRERYVEVVSGGRGVPARGPYPPGLPGYSEDLIPPAYDPARARGLLEGSSYGGAAGLPEIAFTVSGAGSDLAAGTSLLLEMWQQALGVSVRVEQLDSQTYYDRLHAGDHGHLVSTGWCADYPDPENFADILFHSGSPQNFSGYADPALDTMLEQARGIEDSATRLGLYGRIEQRIVDQAPALFLQHASVYYTLVKPYIVGYAAAPVGIAQHMNLSIDPGRR